MRHPRPSSSLAALLAFALTATAGPTSTAGAQAPPALARYTSHTRTFAIDLPAGWRQLAPGEMAPLRATGQALPLNLLRNQPGMFYPLGDVGRWLAGAFDGVYLYVVEQPNEWHSDEQLAQRLRDMWREKGSHDGIDYTVESVTQRRMTLGQSTVDGVECRRTSTPAAPGEPEWSLDVHVPTGGRELSLSFTCRARDRTEWEPHFAAMAKTLTLAQPPRGRLQLWDWLFWPVVSGGIVGAVFLVLYRRNRRRSFETAARQG